MKARNFIAGMFLVLLGVILFLENLGYSSWVFLNRAGDFWPLILIIIGFSILWGRRIPRWVGFSVTVLIAGGLIVLALFYPGNAVEKAAEQTLVIERSSYADVDQGSLEMNFGGGTFSLTSSRDKLVEGEFKGLGAASKVEREGSGVKVQLRQPDMSHARITNKNVWDVAIARDIMWDISVRAGAVEGDLDLEGVQLEGLNIDLGAGEINIVLGDNGERVKLDINAGASSVKLKVPEGTGVRAKLNGALTDTNLDELGFIFANKEYVSTDYETASARIDLELNMSVGQFRLERVSVGRSL